VGHTLTSQPADVPLARQPPSHVSSSPLLYRDMGMVIIDLWEHLTDLRKVLPRSSRG
jgi:hypothetical protein